MKIRLIDTVHLQDFHEFIPEKQTIPYLREEKKGYFSMLTNNGDSNYTMCNHTTMSILEKCDGQATVKMIAQAMCDEYPDTSRDQILVDVVNSLGQLTRLNVIKWKESNEMNKNPYILSASQRINDTASISLAEETDIRSLVDFFKKTLSNNKPLANLDICHYVWGTDYREYLSPTVIRQCLYSYYKDFFVIKENGNITGIIVVKPATEKYLNEASIQFIFTPYNILFDCMENIVDYYSKFPYKAINVLRICIPEAKGVDNFSLRKNLTSYGFEYEGKCENVYCMHQDLYMYYKKIVHF